MCCGNKNGYEGKKRTVWWIKTVKKAVAEKKRKWKKN